MDAPGSAKNSSEASQKRPDSSTSRVPAGLVGPAEAAENSRMSRYCRIDWAEGRHDFAIVSPDGTRPARSPGPRKSGIEFVLDNAGNFANASSNFQGGALLTRTTPDTSSLALCSRSPQIADANSNIANSCQSEWCVAAARQPSCDRCESAHFAAEWITGCRNPRRATVIRAGFSVGGAGEEASRLRRTRSTR